MQAACSNGMHVKKAAAEYGVPTTTLRDRITGRVVHGTKPGHLSSSEETELSHFLKTCTDIGYGNVHCTICGSGQRCVKIPQNYRGLMEAFS